MLDGDKYIANCFILLNNVLIVLIMSEKSKDMQRINLHVYPNKKEDRRLLMIIKGFRWVFSSSESEGIMDRHKEYIFDFLNIFLYF